MGWAMFAACAALADGLPPISWLQDLLLLQELQISISKGEMSLGPHWRFQPLRQCKDTVWKQNHGGVTEVSSTAPCPPEFTKKQHWVPKAKCGFIFERQQNLLFGNNGLFLSPASRASQAAHSAGSPSGAPLPSGTPPNRPGRAVPAARATPPHTAQHVG